MSTCRAAIGRVGATSLGPTAPGWLQGADSRYMGGLNGGLPMGNINWGRLILGGVVAAVILFIVDYIVNGVVLMQQWADAMTALGKPAVPPDAGFLLIAAILSLLTGLTAMWIYAGIRPRYGAGVTTAIYAGLAVWVVGYLVANVFLLVAGLLPASILWTGIIVGLIAVPVATVAGAYLYKEE